MEESKVGRDYNWVCDDQGLVWKKIKRLFSFLFFPVVELDPDVLVAGSGMSVLSLIEQGTDIQQ